MSDGKRTIDLSHPLSAQTPAFPGDPWPEITIFDSSDRPSVSGERHNNCSHLAMSLHCGTHMDAPFHFFGAGRTMDQVPLERCHGPAWLMRLPHEKHPTIELDDLRPHESQLRSARRVVFNTLWHHRWLADNYFTEHPVITGPAAEFLVQCGVQLVGVDTPSVDRQPWPAHLALLGNDVLIVENLTNLDTLNPGLFHLITLPLAILGRDGSPVRAAAVVDSGAPAGPTSRSAMSVAARILAQSARAEFYVKLSQEVCYSFARGERITASFTASLGRGLSLPWLRRQIRRSQTLKTKRMQQTHPVKHRPN